MSAVRVLRTRLLPPRLPPDCVARPRLVDAVRRGLEGRLVAVVAGAGYGKTTLLAQVVAEEHRPWAWCSCDPRVADGASLLAHVAAAIATRFPGMDARLDLSGDAEEAVAELSNEVLETVSDDLVLVLDDVHALPAAASRAIESLAEALPDSLHLAIAGRLPLPVPTTRLGAGRLVEFDEGDLSLTPQEADAVLASIGADLADDARAEVLRRAEGWPAGVILAARAGPGSGARPGAAQFEYLADEVIGAQDERLQAFMVGTAALGRFSPALAAAVTGMEDAAELARLLVRRHLFTVRLEAEGEWFRYHHLLRDMLLRRAAQDGPEALREQHRRAARWWLEVGEPAEGVRHLLEAGDHAGAVAALEPIAEEMVGTEAAETLAGWLDEIPRPLWTGRPRLVLAHAALLLTRAEHEASFAEYETAIGDLTARGDGERAAAALVRLQQDMITAGTRPQARIDAARRWLDRIDPGARTAPVARILVGTSYGYACRFDEALAEIAAGRAMAPGSEVVAQTADVAESFYVRFWRGSPVEALRLIEDAVAALGQSPSADPLGLRLTARILRTYLLNELGRNEEAHAEYAGELTEELARGGWGRTAIRRSGNWVRLTALAGLGRWEELRSHYEPPPRTASSAYPISYTYRYRVPGALLAAHDGAAAAVRDQVRATRQEMAAFGRAFDDASFLVDLAHAAHVAGLVDLSREQARDALSVAREIDSPWLQGRAALALAEVEPGSPHTEAALADALTLTRAYGLEPLWAHRAGVGAAPALLRALEAGIGPPGGAEAALTACGPAAVAEAVRLARDPTVRARLATLAGDVRSAGIQLVDGLLRDPAPAVREAARATWTRLRARPRAAIRIVSLGRLAVLRDGVAVPEAGYGRPRARALLAAVLASGGQGHREVLCERLWPDLSPDRAAAALRTTLHDLRRAIEPELDAGDPSSLLAADAEWVRLVFADRDAWDAAELRQLAISPDGETAEERLARLRAAEALCAGPFLDEWPFEDWATEPRWELVALQEDVTAALAEALEAAGDHAGAVRRLERLVARDPEREGRQRALMRAYASSGDRALALRQYHACRTVLRRAQGVEPDTETKGLYLSILAADEGWSGPATVATSQHAQAVGRGSRPRPDAGLPERGSASGRA